jgi:hypothetical protein
MGSQKRIAKVGLWDQVASNSLWVALLANETNALQELAELIESPPAGITVELVDESNLYEWKVYMEGPEGSPYHVSYYAMNVAPGQGTALIIVKNHRKANSKSSSSFPPSIPSNHRQCRSRRRSTIRMSPMTTRGACV